MDIAEVHTWARKMGYMGKFPEDMSHVVNASTAPIWKQIVNNVRPRSEVEAIRRNLLYYKLFAKQKGVGSLMEVPMKEADIYHKKQQLQEDLQTARRKTREDEKTLDSLWHEINMLQTEIDETKCYLEEASSKEYLYCKKQPLLEESQKEAERKYVIIAKLSEMFQQHGKKVPSKTQLDRFAAELMQSTTTSDLSSFYKEIGSQNLWEMIRSKEEGLKEEINQILVNDVISCKHIEEDLAIMEGKKLKLLRAKIVKNALMIRLLEKQHAEMSTQEVQALNPAAEETVRLQECHRVQNAIKSEMVMKNSLPPQEHRRLLDDVQKQRERVASSKQSLSSTRDSFTSLEAGIERTRLASLEVLTGLKTSGMERLARRLANRIFAEEIKHFDVYNMEHNRKLYYVEKSIAKPTQCRYYRETFESPLALITTDRQTKCAVVSTLGMPLTSASQLIHYFTKKTQQYQKYETMQAASAFISMDMAMNMDSVVNCNLKALRERDGALKPLVDKLRAAADAKFTNSNRLNKETRELWKQMPFAGYVDETIEFKGHTYKYYHDLYSGHFAQMDFIKRRK